jgi:hypothetical protein
MAGTCGCKEDVGQGGRCSRSNFDSRFLIENLVPKQKLDAKRVVNWDRRVPDPFFGMRS